MLSDSLEKKLDILEELQTKNKLQTAILNDPNALPEDLQKNMEQKDNLVDRIEKLDEGFDSIFQRVKDVLEKDRELYADDIRYMQRMIKKITDISVDIQALEQKNKRLAMTKFADVKAQIKDERTSQRVLNSYYQNMQGDAGADSNFYDSKK